MKKTKKNIYVYICIMIGRSKSPSTASLQSPQQQKPSDEFSFIWPCGHIWVWNNRNDASRGPGVMTWKIFSYTGLTSNRASWHRTRNEPNYKRTHDFHYRILLHMFPYDFNQIFWSSGLMSPETLVR